MRSAIWSGLRLGPDFRQYLFGSDYQGVRLRLVLRLLLINLFRRNACIKIVSPKFVAPSVRFNMASDGYEMGGKITIAAGARISEYAVLAPFGGEMQIGRNVYIGSHAALFAHGGGLKIGSDVLIANHVTIVPASHGFSEIDRPMRDQAPSSIGITIMDDVWIGAGARILDGVTLGRGCLVAAGAVVNKSVPEYTIVAGVPARVIATRGQSANTI